MVSVGVILHDQNDFGADIVLVGLGQGVALNAGGFPLPGGILALGAGNDGHFLGNHKGRVEADAELTDDVDIVALVLGLEVERTRLGDGAQVLFQFVLRHADAVVADGQRAALLIGLNVDLQVIFRDADRRVGQALEVALVASVRSVGNQLAQEDLAVCIDRIDHQVEQLFAFGLELTHCHSRKPHLYK